MTEAQEIDIETLLSSLTIESMDKAIEAAEAAEQYAYDLHVKPLADRAEKLRVYRKALRTAAAELLRKSRVQNETSSESVADCVSGDIKTMDELDAEHARSTEIIRQCVANSGGDITPSAVAKSTGYSYGVVYWILKKRTDLFAMTGVLGVPKFSLRPTGKSNRQKAPEPVSNPEPSSVSSSGAIRRMSSEMDAFQSISVYLSASGPQKPDRLAMALSIPLGTVEEVLRGRSFEPLAGTGEYRLRR